MPPVRAAAKWRPEQALTRPILNKALKLDNAKNLTNPSKTVVWGEQSHDKMPFTAVQFRWVDETAKNRKDDVPNSSRASL